MKKRIGKKPGRGGIAGVFSRAVEFPGEMAVRTSDVTLTSNREALVSGCRRVLEYDRERVRLSLCDMEIVIAGEGLTMHAFFGNQIRVCGRITEVKLG